MENGNAHPRNGGKQRSETKGCIAGVVYRDWEGQTIEELENKAH